LLAVAGALLRCTPLAVLALRRVGRLALHRATTAKMHNLSLRGRLAFVPAHKIIMRALLSRFAAVPRKG
jgi:hypothetical protein